MEQMDNNLTTDEILQEYGLDRETYEQCVRDIEGKVDGTNDYDWTEIVEKYNLPMTSDKLRKTQSLPFGGVFMKNYFKGSDELNALRQERIKKQTLMLQENQNNREWARHELFYELVGQYVQRLSVPKFESRVPDDSFTDYIVTFGDIHYGAKFVSEHNEYSPTIAKERIKVMCGDIIDFVQKHNLSHITIVNLGDDIQGILRISDVKLNSTPVVKAVVEVSHVLAEFLNALSSLCDVTYYHVPYSNHTQTRPLGSKANELPQEDLEYVIEHYISDLLADNPRVNVVYSSGIHKYVTIKMYNYSIVALHGHQFKGVDQFRRLYGKSVDYVLIGHQHVGKEIGCYESGDNDVELLVSPSIVGSDPYSDSLYLGSKSAFKIFGFDSQQGHTETYKFLLN